MLWTGLDCEQCMQHGAHVVAPFEAELELGEVARDLLLEGESVVRAGDSGLEAAQQDVERIGVSNGLVASWPAIRSRFGGLGTGGTDAWAVALA